MNYTPINKNIAIVDVIDLQLISEKPGIGRIMEVRYICPTAYDSSIYLVNDRVLIDTGMNGDLVLKQLEKYIKITDLKLIILTHCHYDHTAAAAEIAQKSGADVGIHKADLEGVNDEYFSVSVLFGERPPAVKPTIVYEEGDKIDIGNGEHLEVIHTPGHSRGSICLYEPVSKGLFSGDTVFPGGGFGRMDFEGSEPDKMLGSIEKLTKLDVKTLYSGHGAPAGRDGNNQIMASYRMLKMMMEG